MLRALRLGALLAVVALLPVLTLTAGALVPTALLDPATRTTAPADSELPARPAVPGGDGEGSKKIDWTYNVGTLLDVAAGTAGPIVLTPEGVTALNGEDGSVRWTYRRDTSYVNGHGEQVDRHSPPTVKTPSPRVPTPVMSPCGSRVRASLSRSFSTPPRARSPPSTAAPSAALSR